VKLSKRARNDIASTVTKNTPKSRHGSPKHGSRTGKHHASEGRRSHKEAPKKSLTSETFPKELEATLPALLQKKLDDGWPESEKRVFQAALSMVVVKNSR